MAKKDDTSETDENKWYLMEASVKNKRFLDSVEPDELDINDMCNSYLKCMKTIFGILSLSDGIENQFMYRYFRSPLVRDISMFLKSYHGISIKDVKSNIKIGVMEQLLYILPQRSNFLLPEKFSTLMSRSSRLYDLYPTSTSYKNKRMYYLPWIDMNRIREAVINTVVSHPGKISSSEILNHAKNSMVYRTMFYIVVDGPEGRQIVCYTMKGNMFYVTFKNIFASNEAVVNYFAMNGIFTNYLDILKEQLARSNSPIIPTTETQEKLIALLTGRI